MFSTQATANFTAEQSADGGGSSIEILREAGPPHPTQKTQKTKSSQIGHINLSTKLVVAGQPCTRHTHSISCTIQEQSEPVLLSNTGLQMTTFKFRELRTFRPGPAIISLVSSIKGGYRRNATLDFGTTPMCVAFHFVDRVNG